MSGIITVSHDKKMTVNSSVFYLIVVLPRDEIGARCPSKASELYASVDSNLDIIDFSVLTPDERKGVSEVMGQYRQKIIREGRVEGITAKDEGWPVVIDAIDQLALALQ